MQKKANMKVLNMEEKRKELIEKHMSFAYKKSHLWNKRIKNMDYDSILDICLWGLCKAGKKFDFNRGIKFITFANVVIDNEIRMELRKENKMRNTFYISDLMFEDEEGKIRLGNNISKDLSVPDNTNLVNEYMSLIEGLKLLTKREKKLIYLYIFENMTQKEIGKILGIRQSYVSRLHKKICRKLAKYN